MAVTAVSGVRLFLIVIRSTCPVAGTSKGSLARDNDEQPMTRKDTIERVTMRLL
jgi:hypothetical protein